MFDCIRRVAGLTISLVVAGALLVPTAAQAIDPWVDTGGLVDSVIGQRGCSTTSAISYGSATVTARGSVTCNRSFDELELQVCIQVQQAVVAEGTTWKDYSCAPPVVKSGSGASAAESAACLPGTWNYRSKVVVGAYRTGGETPWTGLHISTPIRVACPLS